MDKSSYEARTLSRKCVVVIVTIFILMFLVIALLTVFLTVNLMAETKKMADCPKQNDPGMKKR